MYLVMIINLYSFCMFISKSRSPKAYFVHGWVYVCVCGCLYSSLWLWVGYKVWVKMVRVHTGDMTPSTTL